MTSPSTNWPQWNVRLEPTLSARLREHLASPLCVGLPKGALASFMVEAVTRELDRRGAPAFPITPQDFDL